MDRLPKRPKQHVSAEKAIRAAKDILPGAWIVREEPQDLDYGIDLEIEIASEIVSGRIFKAQVKGHEKIRWNAQGIFVQAVRPETLTYWKAIPLPVVVIAVDHSERGVYWAPGRRGAGIQGVRVEHRSSLSGGADKLQSFVVDWLDARGEKAILYSLPQYHRVWERLREQIGYDFFLPVGQEDYCDIELFYRQTEILRDILGLHKEMFPWPLWISRSRVTLGDSENLFWGIFDEIVAYLEPIVDLVIEQGRQRLSVETPSVNNLAAMHWASDYRTEYRIRHEFERESRSFWLRIDDSLAKDGALNLKAANGKKFGGKLL